MTSAMGPRDNPFPGLRPFREDEAHLFFGRENQVDAMVDKLSATNFLAVVGTSGSGKSSLVNCGLRPALRQGLMTRGGTSWRMAQFRPGNDPIGAMACELAKDGVLFGAQPGGALSMAEIVETTLRMSRLGLIDICEQASLAEATNVLVVVDQFEELFRYRQLGGAGTFAEDAAAFVNLLLEVKAHPTSRIFVVLTMRSDFLGDCTQFPGLAEAINAGQYLVPRMTRDERRDAIERPVGVGGAQISRVLLTRLVNDVGDNPDQLSILQHALNRTWSLWEAGGRQGPLDLTHYDAIGTMDHALDRHADQAYEELDEHQKRTAEKLFKALTDKANDPRGVRRPTRLATLCALTEAADTEVTRVIDVFRDPSRSFLMPPAGERLAADTVVDISHESLMRVWEKLRKWADDEALSARAYRRLAEAAELHAAGTASLWRDPELQLALDWRDRNQPNEAWASRYHPGFTTAMAFLEQSSDARAAERKARRQQMERERQAEKEKAATQAKYTRWMAWTTGISMLLAVAAVVFGLMAIQASDDAKEKEREAQGYLHEVQVAESRRLTNQAQGSKATSVKVLAALEALPGPDDKVQRPIVSQAVEILAMGLNDLREVKILGGHDGRVSIIAMTPDGSRIATVTSDRTVHLLDRWSDVEVLRVDAPDNVTSLALTPDGGRIVAGLGDGTVLVWDAATGGAAIATLQAHSTSITDVLVTADGSRIVSASRDGARLWDARSGAKLSQFDADRLGGVALAPGGLLTVAGIKEGTARLWDAGTGTELREFEAPQVQAIAMTPDGRRIVAGLIDGTLILWDINASGDQRIARKDRIEPVTSVAVTPDGATVISGSSDSTIQLWDTRTDKPVQFDGHTDGVSAVAVTQDGLWLLSAANDGTARLWDARTGAARATSPRPDSVRGVVAMPDGRHFVEVSDDMSVSLRDAGTDDEIWRSAGHTASVRGAAVTRDGGRIVTGSMDGTVRLWEAATGKELIQVRAPGGGVFSVAVTPDGGRIIGGSQDSIITAWDANTGQELAQMRHGARAIYGLAVTPDGARIVSSSSDAIIRVWATATGAETMQLKGHKGAVLSVALTPDGQRIVSGSTDTTARIWDIDTGATLLQLVGHGAPIASVAVTADGRRVVTGSADGTVRVWDATTGQPLLEASSPPRVSAVTVTPDGHRIVAVAGYRRVSIWDTDTLRRPRVRRGGPAPEILPSLVERARRDVARCLSIGERIEFVLNLAPPAWCIDLGKYPYNSKQWTAWKARRTADAVDESTGEELGNAADRLLKSGDFRKALEAAELGLQFGPALTWISMNKAHALMFLDRRAEARAIYEEHRGKELQQGPWEKVVVKDFQDLRREGRTHPLMAEIEKLFDVSPPREAE